MLAPTVMMQSVSWLEGESGERYGSKLTYLLPHHHPVRLDKSVFRGMLGMVLSKTQ